jgi:hypothetical protein
MAHRVLVDDALLEGLCAPFSSNESWLAKDPGPAEVHRAAQEILRRQLAAEKCSSEVNAWISGPTGALLVALAEERIRSHLQEKVGRSRAAGFQYMQCRACIEARAAYASRTHRNSSGSLIGNVFNVACAAHSGGGAAHHGFAEVAAHPTPPSLIADTFRQSSAPPSSPSPHGSAVNMKVENDLLEQQVQALRAQIAGRGAHPNSDSSVQLRSPPSQLH